MKLLKMGDATLSVRRGTKADFSLPSEPHTAAQKVFGRYGIERGPGWTQVNAGRMSIVARGFGDTIPSNNTAAVRGYTVGKGLTDPYLDAVLTVHGISADAAPRVPSVVKSVLESTGAVVQKAKWGSTAEGTAGKVYVEWKPDKTYNAVDYANIAQRLFKAAAEQFTAGSQIVMPRYRVYRVWPLTSLYAYPTGEGIPASAPELAKSTLPGDIVPGTPGDVALNIEQQVGGLNTWQLAAIAGGGVVALGVGYWLWQRKMKPNRRRRRSVRRNRSGGGISWARSHKDGTVHGRDARGHEYAIDTSDCYTLWVDGHRVTRFESVQAAAQAAERGTALTRNARRKFTLERGPGEDAWLKKHTFSVIVDGSSEASFKGGGAYSEAMREMEYQRGLGHHAWVRDDSTFERAGGDDPMEYSRRRGLLNNSAAKHFEPGDIVRFTSKFMRSTGMYTGGPINGLVKPPPPDTTASWRQDFVYVQWNDRDEPVFVNKHNLELDPRVKRQPKQNKRRRSRR